MDHIILNIRPFIMQQQALVYKDGECVKIGQCSLRTAPETLVTLSKEFGIKDIDLIGSKLYAQKIKDKLASNKFTNFIITIH